MKKNRIITGLSFFILVFAVSCSKFTNKPDLPEDIRILNHWIWDGLNDVYLWEDQIPNLDPDYQEDPEQYFYDLLAEEDHYSWIVDNYEELLAMFNGIELSNGISARPGVLADSGFVMSPHTTSFPDTARVISIVEYVTPDSPALEAGIKRGDIIISIGGQKLTRKNYYSLFYQTTTTFGFGDWNGYDVIPNGKSISLTAVELNQNPVIHSEVIDYQGKKIGYLVYTQFTPGPEDEWLDSLNQVLESFRDAPVSDLVFDLRYNPGGSLDLAAYLASSLAPRAAMDQEEVFVNLVWNEAYNEYWKKQDMDDDGKADGADSEQLKLRFPKSDHNLDLSTVYFLTTDNTASASESLMTGLYPYMNVVQIGTTSYGKCYGSVTITDWAEPKRHSWAMQPIVLKYSNADGFTDFVNGIDPDTEVDDNLLEAKPFGSLEDPLLARALEEITGVYPVAKRSVKAARGFTGMPVPKNRMVERRISLPGAF
jgi:carboxyl-terminal processing protease